MSTPTGFAIHATKKLLDQVEQPVVDAVEPAADLGNRYATGQYDKTASRSLLGVMNEFTFLGNVHREDHGADDDLVALSVGPADTPIREHARAAESGEDAPNWPPHEQVHPDTSLECGMCRED